MTDAELIQDLIRYEVNPHATIDAMNVNKERKTYLHAEVDCWID